MLSHELWNQEFYTAKSFVFSWLLFSSLWTQQKTLRCFHCKGSDDGRPYPQSKCEGEQSEVTCPKYDNVSMVCGKYHHQIQSGVMMHEVEGRACVPQSDCHWIGMSCRAILMAGGDCQYACCQGDLCNNAFFVFSNKAVIVSAFIFIGVFTLL